ncbi:MAG: hypothetical protein WHS83_11310 [Chloroflexus sp.]|uniref:hypothetical protein n=1 Tax=Chloroflexus sp. TaxID=1904827 RepID=UPI0030B6F953
MRRRIVAPGSYLRTSGHGSQLPAVERNASTQAGSLRHGKPPRGALAVQPNAA